MYVVQMEVCSLQLKNGFVEILRALAAESINRNRNRESVVCYDVLVLTFEQSGVMQKAWLVCLASLERRNASEKLAQTVRLAILRSAYACCGSRSSRCQVQCASV
jgi:hypothetical protein